MAYRYGNRGQINMFPASIEEYVGEEAPVRAYDAIVEAMDLKGLGVEIDENQVGNSQYDPVSMIKLLLYGYSYGVRSSRKLERETHYNLSFIWLMGGLRPDHKTIAEFRRNNRRALSEMLKQCARLCIKYGLIEGNTLFIDGTKIRGNAGIHNTWTEKKCKKVLKHLDRRIDEILSECDAIDKEEEGQATLVELREEFKDKEDYKARVKGLLDELTDSEKKSINTTDRECTRVNSVQGTHAGYNAQVVVDEKEGLIVSSDVVSENNDLNQFANQTEKANEILGNRCKVSCADSGYATTGELEEVDKKGIKVVVPSQRQARKSEAREFDKTKFSYDSKRDCYICPMGHRLKCSYAKGKGKERIYRVKDKRICLTCVNYGRCTKSKEGRTIERMSNEEIRLRLEAQYEEAESQKIYKLRKAKVEHPFGHIKRNLRMDGFLLRGLLGVKAEMSILSVCFNVARMITIFGVSCLIDKLGV